MKKNITIQSGPIPKYLQLQNLLMDEIVKGHYQIGDRLCTEELLKARFKLSKATITHALKDLERNGLIVRKKGGGTFVRSKYAAFSHPGPARTLLITGIEPDSDPVQDINWFIGHEIYRGLINNYNGRCQIIKREDLAGQLKGMSAGECCAIVVNPLGENRQLLVEKRIPHVFINQLTGIPQEEINTIAVNRLCGVMDGMTYLIRDLGHRDIALIAPRQVEGRHQHQDRIMGYAMSLHTFNIPVNNKLEVQVPDGTKASGYNAVKELLQRKVKFTAVFTDTDIKALGVIAALGDAGLKVPDDVSVLGFDDVPGMDRFQPPLTTVRVPYFEIGLEAVRMLSARMNEQRDLPGKVLKSSLVIRQSCGPAQQSGSVASLASSVSFKTRH